MNQDIKAQIHSMSAKDKQRLLQCVFCKRDPMYCMSEDEDEDNNGLCKNYIGDMLFVPKDEHIGGKE